MRVSIHTTSKRSIGQAKPFELLKLFLYLIGVWIFFTNIESLLNFADKVFRNEVNWSPKAIWNNETDIKAFRAAFGIVVSTIVMYNDYSLWQGVLRKYVRLVLLKRYRKDRQYYYFKKKVKDDLYNAVFTGREKIQSSLNKTIVESQDLKTISESQENIWLNNRKVYEWSNDNIDQTMFNKILSEFETLDEDILKSRFKEEISKLKIYASSKSNAFKIEFYVATVQPAFYLEANRIARLAQVENLIDIKVATNTGPATIKHCLEAVINPTSTDSERIICFVAPSSAFVTAELNSIDPREYFSPLMTLTRELQHMYYVESGSSTPSGIRRLFYLDNSTAEECVVKKREGLSEVFEPCPISSYTDYKNLLTGMTIKDNTKLRPGDAIVLWSPLIDYFDGNPIDQSHLAKQDLFLNFNNYEFSDIVFFTENGWTDRSDESKAFYQTFITTFALGISLRQRLIRNKEKLGLYDYFVEARYRRRAFKKIYKPAFRELFSNENQI